MLASYDQLVPMYGSGCVLFHKSSSPRVITPLICRESVCARLDRSLQTLQSLGMRTGLNDSLCVGLPQRPPGAWQPAVKGRSWELVIPVQRSTSP